MDAEKLAEFLVCRRLSEHHGLLVPVEVHGVATVGKAVEVEDIVHEQVMFGERKHGGGSATKRRRKVCAVTKSINIPCPINTNIGKSSFHCGDQHISAECVSADCAMFMLNELKIGDGGESE